MILCPFWYIYKSDGMILFKNQNLKYVANDNFCTFLDIRWEILVVNLNNLEEIHSFSKYFRSYKMKNLKTIDYISQL